MSKLSTFIGGAIVGSVAGPVLTTAAACKLSPTFRNFVLTQTKDLISSATEVTMRRILGQPAVRKDAAPTRRTLRDQATTYYSVGRDGRPNIDTISNGELLVTTRTMPEIADVLTHLQTLVTTNKFVSVADLKTLLGEGRVQYNDTTVGWTSIDQFSLDLDRFAITLETPAPRN